MENLPFFEYKHNPDSFGPVSLKPVIKGFEAFNFDAGIPDPETYVIPDFFSKAKKQQKQNVDQGFHVEDDEVIKPRKKASKAP